LRRRAVFLDRDGTINVDVGYPRHWGQVRIYPYAFEAVRKLKEAGFAIVVVTNQSGVGRGFLTEADLTEIHRRMADEFARRGVSLDAFYYCPHHAPSEIAAYGIECACRKPAPGLGLRAAEDLGLDLVRSYMIGDKAEDVLFGTNLGATPILVRTGYGPSVEARLDALGAKPAFVADDLAAAAEWILAREGRPSRAS
jgi:D-glycero-D-manno-heptose 1,7-bisphosphate phosphatase